MAASVLLLALAPPLSSHFVPAGQVRLPSGNPPRLLEGWRQLAASACWLRLNLAWERRDAAAVREILGLTVTLDANPDYYWLNGARMLAYDVPTWTADPLAPEAVRAQASALAAREALAFLERARAIHPERAEIQIEIANIHLRLLHDVPGAASWFRAAADCPGAPHYAARIHAELLCALGRPSEAAEWLRSRLPQLSPQDPRARRDVVLQRISALEAGTGRN